MRKRIFKSFLVFTMVLAMIMGSVTSMAAEDTGVGVDLTLLDTEAHPNSK